MDANANSSNPFRASTFRGCIGPKKRHRLLAEFLHKKYVNINISEEETSSSLELIEPQNDVSTILELDDDLLFKILILLPSESLVKLQFVCKKWFSMINSSVFIRFHTQNYSETVLISQKLTLLEPDSFPDLPLRFESKKAKSYFHLLNLDLGNTSFIESSADNLVEVLATYEGLILATAVDKNNNRSLILMNPVTRKHIPLPLGTFVSNSYNESYGIAFCNEANAYKLVHFFYEKPGGENGSEILNVSTRKWTRILEGPSNSELLRKVKWRFLVSIGGSLHWIPRRRDCDYFVSMNVTNEKFYTKNLPIVCGLKDRLVDIGGILGFVARAEVDILQVWILMNINDVNWVKRYSINLNNVDGVGYPIPICSLRNGKEMVFENPRHRLCVYGFEKDEMKLMVHSGDNEVWFRIIHKNYIPHRNTLASWDDHHQVIR